MNATEIIEKFVEENGIVFELRAVNSDGEVIAEQTSNICADDLCGREWIIDEAIEKLALSDEDDEDFSESSDENDI